jgi:nicotinamidase-related amidase
MAGAEDFLLVIDFQRDFCPGGALAVPLINQLVQRFDHVVLAFIRTRTQ